MTLTIPISDELVAVIEAKAAAEGLSAERYMTRILEEDLIERPPLNKAKRNP